MSQMIVSSGQLATKRDELNNLIESLEKAKEEYMSAEKSMSAKWEGEAKTAFDNSFTTNMQKIETFVNGARTYVQALDNIIREYETTELKNTGIAGGQ